MATTQVILNTFQRGPGYWKFNSALLSEPEFVTEMSDFITSHFENYKNENPLTAWEMFKVYAKHRCQDYSKKRSRRNVTHKEQLLQQLKATENQLCVEPRNKDLHRKHLQIKKELGLHDIQLAKGAQMRARDEWIEGEKNTKYFLRREKARGTSNTISSMRIENKYTDDPTKILAEIRTFYENLCIGGMQKDTSRNIKTHFLANDPFPTLSEEERAECEKEITIEELSHARTLLNKDAAPGCDGFPQPFTASFGTNYKGPSSSV